MGTSVVSSGSARDELSSAAEDSTKPESFLFLRAGDLLLLACSTSGSDRDKSGFQASRAPPSLLLPELREELSKSSSGVELALGRDRDLLLGELPCSCRAGPGRGTASPRGCGEHRLGLEALRPQLRMVWSLQ